MAGQTPGRSPRRRLLLSVAACATVLIASELAVRALEPSLAEPSRWPDQATLAKTLQMDALGCADVVFTGNSMARDGLDPSYFTSTDPAGRTAYNAALDAATPSQLDRWLTDEVLPRLRPSTVVLAIASADLNEHSVAGRAAFDAYGASVGGRTGPLGDLQRVLVDVSALARNRDGLRDPGELTDALHRALGGEQATRTSPAGVPGVIGPTGEGLSRRDRVDAGGSVARRFLTEELLGDYAVSTDETAALVRTIDHLREAGTEPVLVVLPVTGEYVGLHPAGATDFQEFLDAIDEVAEETGTPLLDLHDAITRPESFADTHHLNAAGSTELTRMIVERISDDRAPRCEGSR